MISKNFLITDKQGMHARPASSLVKVASKYSSQTELNIGERKANVRSIISIMTLNIKSGERVTLVTDGPDEEVAMASLIEVIEKEKIGQLI
ncbi:HPr family phosphocarrier protein [Ferdinandcohnia sp. Marseille-Q9671]